ncbi:MAG: glycoside hydrolase family 3 protein, partial [Verrucomicrobiales bacterium]
MKNDHPADEENWVETTLLSMSLAEKIGHLMCPTLGDKSEEDIAALLEKVPLGSAFFSDWDSESAARGIEILQKHSRIPLLIAADMESGPNFGTVFPNAMGCSAAQAENLMFERGRITAREARSVGFHWSFAPCVDINYNFKNVETGLRSWGDRPDQIIRMVPALIRGMQDEGRLAATAKHFPGTGMDDRDQHLCTAVNPLPIDKWLETYGRVWKACFDVDVMSVMPGHISLPAWEGLDDRPADAMPATLNKALQHDLLREELGFDGVVVSDAGVMIGCASRIRKEDMMLQNILTGGDVFLFP